MPAMTQNLKVYMNKAPETRLLITEQRGKRDAPRFFFPSKGLGGCRTIFTCSVCTVRASIFDGCCVRGSCLFILEVICEDDRPAFWARREGDQRKSKELALKLGANVYLSTCPLALVHFPSAPLTMLQDGGTAHLWNNISTVVTNAKTAPSLSLGCSHQSAT